MRSPVAGWLCLASILMGGSMFGQQAPPAEPAPAEKKEPVVPPKHKVGPLEISVNWRTRAEGWIWFEGKTENSDYGLFDSLLRGGIVQRAELFTWLLEQVQP